MNKKIYLAGPLFGAADRMHNLNLERRLTDLGYEIILPQRRALNFMTPNGLNLQATAADCAQLASSPDHIVVANIDGSDADSGTAVEYGLAIASGKGAVLYRTDIRTAPEKEVGLNAMLTLGGTKLVQLPCFVTTIEEAEEFYDELAHEIHRAIQTL